MRIPPYWVKGSYTGRGPDGKEHTFEAYGWSFESEEDAKATAEEHAKAVFERVTSGEEPEEYEYLERPIREEIVDTLSHDGEEIGKITRNRYGARVLNARTVCFVDVDFPAPESNGFIDRLLMMLFSSHREKRREEVREETIDRIRSWAESHPDRCFRMYRTYAGLRLLFTDDHYDPTSERTDELLQTLGSDDLYRKLTEKQECFRARLTPKPWRVGAERPPASYPFDDAGEEQSFHRWLERYKTCSEDYATCKLIDSIGTGAENGDIQKIVDVHDEACCKTRGSPLA